MSESRVLKTTANRIAKKFNTEYIPGVGADVKTDDIAIKVVTPDSIVDGMRELRGHRKPVYLAGTNKATVNAALEAIKGTTVGVMDSQGNIVEESKRK
jgi:hypothetical protein